MEQFNIWGQIQEVAGGRYLVIAMACPLEAGRETCFSKVLDDPEEAKDSLGGLMDQLERQIASAGDRVVSVNRLEDRFPSNEFPPRRPQPQAHHRRLS